MSRPLCFMEIADDYTDRKPTMIRLDEASVWYEPDRTGSNIFAVHIQCHAKLKCILGGLKESVASYMVRNIEDNMNNADDFLISNREGMTVKFEVGRKKSVI